MASRCEQHVPLSELPRGVRRRCVWFAIGMTWVAFCAFLGFVACWVSRAVQHSDSKALAIIALINATGAIGHGIHAKLRLQNMETKSYTTEPGAFDFTLLAFSVLLFIAGCCLFVVAAQI